jgi:hypothetical protein
MLTENNLQELLEFRAQAPVLSVYLNTEPVEGGVEPHKLYLRSMLKDVDMPDDVFVV